MIVQFLGTAAGGGFPQWNCHCRGCQLARTDPKAAWPRSQSAVAVSADGSRWLLLNASPDVRSQLAQLPVPATTDMRAVPFAAIALTDAELDHTLGIPLLREGGRLHIYCTMAVRDMLADGAGLLRLTAAFADVAVHPLSLGTPVEPVDLDGRGCGLTIEAFAVAGDPPRFASRAAISGAAVVGLRIEEIETHAAFVYVPGCGALTDDLRARLDGAAAIAFDGTFWRDDEMIAGRTGTRTAAQMGHVPIDGPGGSLQWLAALTSARRIYTHINNTNPILIEDSAERRAVVAAGITVGFDGLRLEL